MHGAEASGCSSTQNIVGARNQLQELPVEHTASWWHHCKQPQEKAGQAAGSGKHHRLNSHCWHSLPLVPENMANVCFGFAYSLNSESYFAVVIMPNLEVGRTLGKIAWNSKIAYKVIGIPDTFIKSLLFLLVKNSETTTENFNLIVLRSGTKLVLILVSLRTLWSRWSY